MPSVAVRVAHLKGSRAPMDPMDAWVAQRSVPKLKLIEAVEKGQMKNDASRTLVVSLN